ncbi:MAG: glycerol-3-phosphate dehydrogenase/oxidase [Acidobacteriota bacterium]|nr:glycerol-3-phosphate dehydrogenase/oxidase [Acidobacteriota bacterium]
MKREEMLARVRARTQPWDMIVIGGGATGAGIAVDAASRGYDVLLLEREDFGKGTSSRATKLVHGGVRYLEQGNVSLVMEALKERGILRRNAPHIVHDLRFIVPNYSWWEAPFYGIGMKVYDLLAGRYSFGSSRVLSFEETLELLPAIRQDGLRGGVMYHDGQFDDSRLLINLITTAAEHGATVLNYAAAVELIKDDSGFVKGVVAHEREGDERFTLAARCVINATGIFTDEVRRMAEPTAESMMAPSQGIHLVFDSSFLTGNTALLVPHTDDGRVLFAVPWNDRTLVGTTDTPVPSISYEPLPFEEEIDFVLETAGRYLTHKPTREDILSVFVGIRPLVRAAGASEGKTSTISRDYTIHIDHSALLTIAGGKWTTYRHMAEDCVDHAITLGALDEKPCTTATERIHGYHEHPAELGALSAYGSDAAAILQMVHENPALAEVLHPDLPYIAAEIVWAARHEMSRTLDDALARRTRALLLNARAAVDIAPAVAALLARELGKDHTWIDAQIESFRTMGAQYIPQGTTYPSAPAP